MSYWYRHMNRLAFCEWNPPTAVRSTDKKTVTRYIMIKLEYFPRHWPFVRGIHWSPANSPHKGQWRGALVFPLICTWKTGTLNSRVAGDLRLHRSHYNVTVMNADFYVFSMNQVLNKPVVLPLISEDITLMRRHWNGYPETWDWQPA